MQIIYETLQYNEFDMEKALAEYGEEMGKSAIIVATKHNVPVMELHREYAKSRIERNDNIVTL